QGIQAQALGRQVHGASQQLDLIASRLRLLVEIAHVFEQIALSRAQLNGRLVALEFRLANLAPPHSPVPDREVQTGRNEISIAGQGAQVGGGWDGSSQREGVRLDAVNTVHGECREERLPCYPDVKVRAADRIEG